MNITISEHNDLWFEEQREKLLEMNYDRLYGVYELVNETSDTIELKLLDNSLVAFQNQLHNLNGLNTYKDISILDLQWLSKWKIEVLSWPNRNFWDKKIIMCSWWMIDFFTPDSFSHKKWEKHLHMITSLRDAWATSHNQRTTVAGRILWDDIRKNIEIESAEESPFLGMMDWKFYLAIGNDYFSYLKEAVKLFLEEKYDPKNLEFKKMFERWFRGIKYEELWSVLEDIIANNRIVKYKSEELDNIEWLDHLRKKVKIGEKEETFYAVFNPILNTYEFKTIKKFIWFPEWFTLPGKRLNRLFLESFHQYPRLNRISNADKINPSWAIKIFSEEIVKNVDTIISQIL